LEVLARMRGLMRRAGIGSSKEVMRVAGVNIDTTTREVVVNGQRIDLSAKEFLLLQTLARDPQRVFRKQELLELVWGYRSAGATRTLDSHASRLRRKLTSAGAGRAYIANVWGVGYRLVAAEPMPA
jgi:DNA-binding response OmpR family regulator